jgi:hypothetical protein
MNSSDSTPTLRKRKSTQSGIQSTPKEPKRKRVSKVESEDDLIAVSSSSRSVGRKRKVSSEPVDSSSVDGSVDEDTVRNLRSGRKRANVSTPISDSDIAENISASAKPPRSNTTGRKSIALKEIDQTDDQSANIHSPATTGDSYQAAQFSSPQRELSTASRQLSESSLASLTPVSKVNSRSSSKTRKSLSRGIAAISHQTPTTPSTQNIVISISPREAGRPTPHTPAIVAENTTIQIAPITNFPFDETENASVYGTMHVEEVLTLEDSNNWLSWISAGLLILVTIGSFLRQLTVPAHEFYAPKVAMGSSINTSTVPSVSDNLNMEEINKALSLLPDIDQLELLHEETQKQSQQTDATLNGWTSLVSDHELVKNKNHLHEAVSQKLDELDQQLRDLESIVDIIEQHPELIPEDAIAFPEDLANGSIDDAELFSDSYSVRDDPPAILESFVGSTTREFRHTTDGLSPEQYQVDTQQQLQQFHSLFMKEIENRLLSEIENIYRQLREEAEIIESAERLEDVSHQIEHLVEQLTGKPVSFRPESTKDAVVQLEKEIFPSIEQFILDIEEIVKATNHRIAKQVDRVGEKLDTMLRDTISAAVLSVIDFDKSTILRQVVNESAVAAQGKILSMPKVPLDLSLTEAVDEEDEDDDSQIASLEHSDDVASSATGARMILLESSTYCVKSKGDPISCAASNLRMVNNQLPIEHASDCYAFGKLEKNDALTVRFYQPSTVFGFGLSHFFANAGAADSEKYNIECAPRDVYITLHQLKDNTESTTKRGKLPKLFRSAETFNSIDSKNFTFVPAATDEHKIDENTQGYTVTQSFALDAPVLQVSKATLHIRSTHNADKNMACVYRFKVYGKLSD